MNRHKKYTAKPYSVLVIDATHASDNTLHFRQNLLELMIKLKMKDYNMILAEKQQKNQHYCLEKLVK